jgi:heat shock protein HslJ
MIGDLVSHHRRRSIATAIAVGVLALAACGGTVDPEAIQGAWVLESVVIDGEPYELPFEYAGSDGVLALLRFEEAGVLRFQAPCNDGRSDYQFDGRELTLTGLMYSAGYCYPAELDTAEESPLMIAEEVILASMRAGTIEVTFSGAEPEIMEWSQDGTVMTFHREPEN